jgi:high-affinity nickel-transport protein
VGLSLELGVAMMLVIIGLLTIDAFARRMKQFTDRTGAMPSGLRADGVHGGHERFQAWERSPRLIRPFCVGCVHGMAGSAALSLLVLPLIHDSFWAMIYLLIFGFGSIAGMMLITAAIAWPCLRLAGSSRLWQGRLATAAGVLSLGLGLFLVYDIGVVQGLFFALAL